MIFQNSTEASDVSWMRVNPVAIIYTSMLSSGFNQSINQCLLIHAVDDVNPLLLLRRRKMVAWFRIMDKIRNFRHYLTPLCIVFMTFITVYGVYGGV